MNNCLTRIKITQEKLEKLLTIVYQDQTNQSIPEHFKNVYYKIIDNVDIAN